MANFYCHKAKVENFQADEECALRSLDSEASESFQDRPLNFPRAAFDIVALAASTVGLNALSQVLSHLPANFPAAIFVMQHLNPKRCIVEG